MEPQLEGCGKYECWLELTKHVKLQWSRNLRVAERPYPRLARVAPNQLQWSRNLRVAESAAQKYYKCLGRSFNGAAT